MDLAGRRVVVMGLGRFGGGVGATRFLVQRGASVLVTDLLPERELAQSLAQLEDLPPDRLRFRLGGHDEADFASADLVVVNPAVKPRTNPYIEAATRAGVPLTTEVRLLIEHLPNRQRTIGVTGTAGKSTTTAMIGHVLRKIAEGEEPAPPRPNQRLVPPRFSDTRSAHPPDTAPSPPPSPPFHVWVGGNLGGSLLPVVDQIQPDDWVVLELSSFMLEYLRPARWSPHVAVVTNLMPNHLDWHGSLDAYAAAKRVILDHQSARDVALLGPLVSDWVSRARTFVLSDRPPTLPLLIPGEHNQFNANAALNACEAALPDRAWRDPDKLVADFPGLTHRLQFVAERDGVRCFNDSKSTTPEAAMLAIRSFEPGTVHVILGGYDKGSDLTPLARLAAETCAGIYTIGATGDAIADAAEQSPGSTAKVMRCGTLERAVEAALNRAAAGEVVLLSPGCASWDQFTNYEQRGEQFTELMNCLST